MKKENIFFQELSLKIKLKNITFEPNIPYLGEHFHNEIEIVCVKHGKIACRISGSETVLNKNDILIINSRVVHRLCYYGCVAEATYLQIDIDQYLQQNVNSSFAGILSFINDSNTVTHKLFSDGSDISFNVNGIISELTEKSVAYQMCIKGFVYRLLGLMTRCGMLNDHSKIGLSRELIKFEPTLNYITENFKSKISLEDARKLSNTDRYSFCKQFKKATGVTFVEYITYLRLRYAEDLLLNTDLSITEIALTAGFNSLQYFNRVFIRKRHYPPSKYRKIYFKQQSPTG